jgi:hypothetical protein
MGPTMVGIVLLRTQGHQAKSPRYISISSVAFAVQLMYNERDAGV